MESHKNMSPSSHMSTTSSYKMLFWGSFVHFAIMYAVMYTMVFSKNEIYLNVNNVYMTGMMLAPMIVIMLFTMSMMFQNKKLNFLITIFSVIVFALLYSFMRNQTLIGDKEFLRSMIPHHSGAILMCGEAKIYDAEIKTLCSQIIQGQKNEVDQMKRILKRL